MFHQVPVVGAPYELSSHWDAPAHAGCSIVFHHPEPCCRQESLPQEWHGAVRVLTHPSRCHDASAGQLCKTPPGAEGLPLCFKALPELPRPLWRLRQKYQPGRVMWKWEHMWAGRPSWVLHRATVSEVPGLNTLNAALCQGRFHPPCAIPLHHLQKLCCSWQWQRVLLPSPEPAVKAEKTNHNRQSITHRSLPACEPYPG